MKRERQMERVSIFVIRDSFLIYGTYIIMVMMTAVTFMKYFF